MRRLLFELPISLVNLPRRVCRVLSDAGALQRAEEERAKALALIGDAMRASDHNEKVAKERDREKSRAESAEADLARERARTDEARAECERRGERIRELEAELARAARSIDSKRDEAEGRALDAESACDKLEERAIQAEQRITELEAELAAERGRSRLTPEWREKLSPLERAAEERAKAGGFCGDVHRLSLALDSLVSDAAEPDRKDGVR